MLDKRSLIHDRDSKFAAAFDQYIRDNGVEPVVLPPKSPNLNTHCERFVRSIKEEGLDRMIFTGEASLRYAIRCYLSHYHAERNHQGLDNQLITPGARGGPGIWEGQTPKAPGWPAELLPSRGRMSWLGGQPTPMLSVKYGRPDISTLRDGTRRPLLLTFS